MKAALSIFLILFFTTMSVLSVADNHIDAVEDYCYKPSEPLFFSSFKYKKRYEVDFKEYQHCKQSFIDMQQRIAELRSESEKNAQRIWERYDNKNAGLSD